MVKRTTNKIWMSPSDVAGFQRCIADLLESPDADENINTINDKIVTALLESQNRCCPKTKREDKLSQATRQLMQERRDMRSENLTTTEELRQVNKPVSKAIRKDIRTYNKKEIKQTIEDNKSMKVCAENSVTEKGK